MIRFHSESAQEPDISFCYFIQNLLTAVFEKT